MSFPYEGPQNALRLRMRPPVHKLDRMEDLPMKRKTAPKPSTLKPTWEKRKADAEQKVKRVQTSTVKRAAKPLPPLQGGYKESQHPRDRFGRFVVKAVKATGHAVKSTAKATGKVVKGTAKAVKRAHKSIKRVQSNARRRASLEHRERKIALVERGKKVVRKRARK